MKSYLFSHPLKKVIQIVLLLALLFLSFGPGGTGVAYAAPPVHDDFDNAKLIDDLIYFDEDVDTRDATPSAPNGPFGDDPDNIDCQDEELNAGFGSVWYKYTPTVVESISLDTIDSDYDTFIAVWTGTRGSLELEGCGDETFEGFTEMSFIGQPGQTYYIEVARYNDGSGGSTFSGGILQFHAYITNTNVRIGNVLRGRYYIPESGGLRRSFLDLNSGPVEIHNVAENDIIAAERIIYNVRQTSTTLVSTSYSEMMGLPQSQLDTIYWLPWYNNNNGDLDTQLRFGNVSPQQVSVKVFIGGTERTNCTSLPSKPYPYVLGVGESMRVSCPGLNDGPVEIRSTGGDIVAAERMIYKINNVPTSFSEMMAFPNDQLTTTYWLPWYNNVGLDTQLRFGNVSPQQVSVKVVIGGIERTNCTSLPSKPYPYVLGIGESVRVSCPGLNAGPVRIVSTGGDIVAAERVIYRVGGVPVSFTEMMGIPDHQLSTSYWMPWYNNVGLDTQLRFGNVSNQTVSVKVFIGGTERTNCTVLPSQPYPYQLSVNESVRVSCPNVNNGPVNIVSTGGDIVVAGRVIYTVAGKATSFSEMMAMPGELLDFRYWMPWYNNDQLDTQLRFALPALP